MTVTERLRQAVENCGESRASMSRATGINEGILSRFVVNGDGLRSDTLDRLCEHLELELTAKGRKRKGR